MVTEYEVYRAFRVAQSNVKNRGFRMPKDFDAHLVKMKKSNAQQLYKMMVYFNTTYSNVDVDGYMNCGFELWKTFSYHHFCDNKILELYKQKDKAKKRQIEGNRTDIERSFAEIRRVLIDVDKRDGYKQIQNFCKMWDNNQRIIIKLYLSGKIDNLTLTYCIFNRYVILSDDDRGLMPYITKNYRELVENVTEMREYFVTMEEDLERTV